MENQTFPIENGFKNIRSFDDRTRLYAFNDCRNIFDFLYKSNDTIDVSSIQSLGDGNSRKSLRSCIDILANRNLEVVALDLTTEDIAECGLNVIKILIPGCEQMEGDHLAQFLGGLRWKTVPKELGFRSSLPDIADINPYPHPYP